MSGLEEAARKAGRRRGKLVIGALDETGQQKKGEATAGVKRQHLGCAGRVANGINTVHLSYVREGIGHALIGFRQWIPAEHITDPVRSLRMGLPPDLTFRTKGQLAIDICTTAAADGFRLRFLSAGTRFTATAPSCGPTSRTTEQAYVLRVQKTFRITLPNGTALSCAQAVKTLLAQDTSGGGKSAPPARAPKASGGTRGPGSPPPHPVTTCSSANTYAPVSWPSTTATCPKGNCSPRPG